MPAPPPAPKAQERRPPPQPPRSPDRPTAARRPASPAISGKSFGTTKPAVLPGHAAAWYHHAVDAFSRRRPWRRRMERSSSSPATRIPQLAAGDRRLSRDPADQGGGAALRRHGDLRRDPGERPRRRRFRPAVDVVPDQRPSDGAADHHRRAAPLVGPAHHRGDPLFRLRPAGPQTGPAHADLGQARRQPDHHRRRRPRDDARPARRPDPGLLRHPDRQPLRLAGDGARHQGALRRRPT